MFTLPCNGPFGCFDYYGTDVICIDEAQKLVLKFDINGENIEKFSLPSQLYNNYFCWIKIYFVSGKFILGLLKSHEEKLFHLITLQLNHSDKTSTLLKHVRTGISSFGFKVEAHRSMSQFVFSICNTKFIARKTKKSSDRESFMKQLKASQEEYIKDDDIPELSNEKIIESCRKPQQNIIESVLLLVRTEANGDIIPTILSTGRRRFGIKLHRTRTLRELQRTFSKKFMTRWKTRSAPENSCEPFLWGNNACVLSKDDPSFFYVAHTILNPKSGLIASILYKLRHRFRLHTPVTEPIQNKINGTGPSSSYIWSNIDIIQGSPTFLTMDTEKRTILKWQIRRDVFSNFEWSCTELDFYGPENTNKIMFRSNSEHITSLEFTIRFQLTKSDGKSYFHNVSLPRIVFNSDENEFC